MRLSRAHRRVAFNLKKFYFSYKSTDPYISPDTFRELSDFDFHIGKEIPRRTISESKIIFCNSGNIEAFFSEYAQKITASVLIFGNNDVDFLDFPHKIPKSVRRIFLQNSMISDGFFRTLPIGIESLRYAQNGLPGLFGEKYFHAVKNGRELVGPFGDTHPERKELLSLKSVSYDNVDFISKRFSPKEYAKVSSRYTYVACPRGNGLDTHRFWEALYRGSYPIVLRSNWSYSIKELGIPIIEVDDWDSGLRAISCDEPISNPVNPILIPALWSNYWEKIIRSEI
jgi:hypothetical protein